MEIQYQGEHLLPGQLGSFLILLSLTSALLSTVAYIMSNQKPLESLSWKKIGRYSFYIHGFSVVGIVSTLFYVIYNYYFEYYYAWQHANKSLPFKYMFSCFWEGQEGSFLLWIFWQTILGFVLIRFHKSWEAPVMAVFASVQAFLVSMLQGFVLFGYKFGSNPFTLLRNHPDFADLPFVKVPNYLENLDGRGLNPLLQNYWMTIHPPTLFLGFALTLVPFAFAIAGLWNRKTTEWIKPALPWTFIGIVVLGVGILMGGAWAYESLSFGGFWAWDPVENASLVPWLTLVAAGHMMLVQKTRKINLGAVLFFTIISFILVLYSTFLTRSGVLGETSVHAFTDLGMSGQLLIYLLTYFVGSVSLIFYRIKDLLAPEKGEEEVMSREFWMFIGSLILAIASFQIIFTTSIPVINKALQLKKKIAPPTDVITHYNSWQLPFAVAIALLMAVSLYFKYKKTDPAEFVKGLALPFGLSLIITFVFAWQIGFSKILYGALFFTSVLAVLANFWYLLVTLKGKIKLAGAVLAHIGFGLILLGVLISTSLKQIISHNTSGISVEQLGKEFKNSENIMLAKGDTLQMADYYVTFKRKYQQGIHVYHEIEYLTKKGNQFQSEFVLSPVIQLNDRMGNVAEPDTRHFLHKDVYTHITYAELEKTNKDPNEWDKISAKGVSIGDSIFSANAIIRLIGLNKAPDKEKYKLVEGDLAISAVLEMKDIKGNTYQAEPLFLIRNNYVYTQEAEVQELGLKFKFEKIDPATGKIDITLLEKPGSKKEFVVMKAMVFPGINILWLGCLIMAIGTLIAVVFRIKQILTKG